MRAVVSEGPSKPARRSSLREAGGAGWSTLAWQKSDEQGPRAVRAHYHGKSVTPKQQAAYCQLVAS